MLNKHKVNIITRIHNTEPLKIGQKVLKRDLKDARRKEKLVQEWSAHP